MRDLSQHATDAPAPRHRPNGPSAASRARGRIGDHGRRTRHRPARGPARGTRPRARRAPGHGGRGAGPDDLRLAGGGREPRLRAAARPRPAGPQPGSTSRRSTRPSRASTPGTYGACTSCGPADRARSASRRCRGRRSASTARGRTAPPMTRRAARLPAARRARRDPRRRRDPARRRRPDATGPVRPARAPSLAQGRVAPAHRRLQAARAPTSAAAVADARRSGAAGLITYSSGNHAQGVARAARLFGVPAVIVMPSDSPALKRARVEADGAEVVIVGHGVRGAAPRRRGDRRGRAASRSSRPTTTRGSWPDRARPAWRSPRTCRTSPRSSSRSAAAGWRAASRRRSRRCAPGARVIGVEPELAADARESLAAGRIVEWPAERVSRTIADGTRTQSIGRLNFAHLSTQLDAVVTVSEAEIAAAVRLAAEEARLVVEPSGALPIAAMRFRAAEAGLVGLEGPIVGVVSGRQRGPGPLPCLPRGADPAGGIARGGGAHPCARHGTRGPRIDSAVAGAETPQSRSEARTQAARARHGRGSGPLVPCRHQGAWPPRLPVQCHAEAGYARQPRSPRTRPSWAASAAPSARAAPPAGRALADRRLLRPEPAVLAHRPALVVAHPGQHQQDHHGQEHQVARRAT